MDDRTNRATIRGPVCSQSGKCRLPGGICGHICSRSSIAKQALRVLQQSDIAASGFRRIAGPACRRCNCLPVGSRMRCPVQNRPSHSATNGTAVYLSLGQALTALQRTQEAEAVLLGLVARYPRSVEAILRTWEGLFRKRSDGKGAGNLAIRSQTRARIQGISGINSLKPIAAWAITTATIIRCRYSGFSKPSRACSGGAWSDWTKSTCCTERFA